MAIPKKGSKKIVVDGKNYLYRTKVRFGYGGKLMHVVIEDPDGKVKVHDVLLIDGKSFTPRDVEQLITGGV